MPIVKITKPAHIRAMNRFAAVATVIDEMEAAEKAHPRLPGFGLAKSIVTRLLAEERTRVLTWHMKAAQAAGFDITTHKVVSSSLTEILVEPIGDGDEEVE